MRCCATVTVTDITQKPRSIWDLLINGSGAGYTVAPSSTGGQNPSGPLGAFQNIQFIGGFSYLSIQASPGNANGQNILVGDEGLVNSGAQQGKELTPGTIDVHQSSGNLSVHAQELYITATQNNLKANLEWHYA